MIFVKILLKNQYVGQEQRLTAQNHCKKFKIIHTKTLLTVLLAKCSSETCYLEKRFSSM